MDHKTIPPAAHTQWWITEPCSKQSLQIAPGGLLVAIRVTGQPRDLNWWNARIRFELTDHEHAGLYAEMVKPAHYDYGINCLDLLMIMPEGIPNMNSAQPYLLTYESDIPVGLRSVTVYHHLL